MGSLVLAFNQDGRMYQGFQIIVGHGHNISLQFLMKSI
jgi:hypothetical protein